MDPLAIMVVVANRAMTHEAHSALPDAPVVPDDDRVPASTRPRAAAATLLRRVADAVAPPARQIACAGGR